MTRSIQCPRLCSFHRGFSNETVSAEDLLKAIKEPKWMLSPTLLLFIRSVTYLFIVQCVLLGPAYATTLCCFILHTILEFGHSLLNQLVSKTVGDKSDEPRRTVLINGCTQTTSLHIARSLHKAGYRIVACDFPQNWLNPTRFSMAVDEYYTVPRPENGVQEYVRSLCEIVKHEKVDVFFPVATAGGVLYDALAKAQLEGQGCECFIPSAEHVRKLSNKVSFFEHASRCGFNIPQYYKVTCISEIMQLYESGILYRNGPFILTSLRCNSKYMQDSVLMPRTIEEFITNIGEYDSYSCTLLLQQFIRGRHLTTSTTVLEGKVIAHSACYCESPYEFDPVQTENSLAWIQTFFKMYPTKLTGNFIFNFVVSSKKQKLYPESCVPGVGIAVMTFPPERTFGQNILTDVPSKIPLHPKASRPVYWFYEELWRTSTTLATIPNLINWLWKMCVGYEAVFSFSDPLPFIALNHLHLPFLVFVSLLQRKKWSVIDFCAGKLQS